MDVKELGTENKVTWCPGCPNNGILLAAKQAIASLVEEKKICKEDVVGVTGIGCHAKIYDYLNVNGFYGLHGRVLPVCFGAKLGNPKLRVIGFGGDGDTYAEGVSHFVHSCRYNADMTMLVHNNQVFALTTGQATPTSEEGFENDVNPGGSYDRPLNPLLLALTSGASFVARGYALDVPHFKELIKEAIMHKGFSYVDILQPCVAFHDTREFFKKNVYKLEKHDAGNFDDALEKAGEWNYSLKGKVAVGVFYKEQRKVYEEQLPQLRVWKDFERKVRKGIVEDFR